jgi:hypothetical protein
MASDEEQVQDVRDWFASMGYRLTVRKIDADCQDDDPDCIRFAVDLLDATTGKPRLLDWAHGPDPTIAIVALEQRWVTEQIGRSRGLTGLSYQELARRRLREGRHRSIRPGTDY